MHIYLSNKTYTFIQSHGIQTRESNSHLHDLITGIVYRAHTHKALMRHILEKKKMEDLKDHCSLMLREMAFLI